MALEIRHEEIGRYDYAKIKAIKARLQNGFVKARTPEIEPPKIKMIIPPSNLPTAQKRLYPVPIGPSKPRDWLLIASTSKDEDIRRDAPRIKVRRLIDIVADVYGVSVECLKSARRQASVVRARQEAMWLCRKYTLHSLPEIGRLFGGRDHTTALHAVRAVDRRIAEQGYICEAEAHIQDYLLYCFREDAAAPQVEA